MMAAPHDGDYHRALFCLLTPFDDLISSQLHPLAQDLRSAAHGADYWRVLATGCQVAPGLCKLEEHFSAQPEEAQQFKAFLNALNEILQSGNVPTNFDRLATSVFQNLKTLFETP